MPEISIIIPNFNHISFLEKRIESVLNQTFMDFELILMDDSSTDNSQELIRSYLYHKKVSKIILNKTNSGSPFHQWHTGIQAANGKWIWIAESDDFASPDFLEKMWLLINKKPQISIAYCDSSIEQEGNSKQEYYSTIKNDKFQNDKWSHAYTKKGIDELNESLKWECTINNVSAALFNAQMAKSYSFQLSPFRYHGDWMFYILIAAFGNIAYTAEKLNTYRKHGKNHTQSQVPEQVSKTEKFMILNQLLKMYGISERKRVFRYFLKHHVGYGILNGPAFGKNGYMKTYSKISPQLSRRLFFGLLTERLKSKMVL